MNARKKTNNYDIDKIVLEGLRHVSGKSANVCGSLLAEVTFELHVGQFCDTQSRGMQCN